MNLVILEAFHYMILAVNCIVQLSVTDYENGLNKILPGSVKLGLNEDILQLGICSLYWLVSRSSLLPTENFVAFIDFEKASDSINKNLSWPRLLKNGINGMVLRYMKCLYNNVKAGVRLELNVQNI